MQCPYRKKKELQTSQSDTWEDFDFKAINVKRLENNMENTKSVDLLRTTLSKLIYFLPGSFLYRLWKCNRNKCILTSKKFISYSVAV